MGSIESTREVVRPRLEPTGKPEAAQVHHHVACDIVEPASTALGVAQHRRAVAVTVVAQPDRQD